MPTTAHSSPGGGDSRRRRIIRVPSSPARARSHLPIGSIPALDFSDGPRPRSFRRFKVKVLPPLAEFQVRKYHTLDNELNDHHSKIVESALNRARGLAEQVHRALQKPTPKIFYPALIRYLSLQENLFQDLLSLRTKYESRIQRIARAPTTPPHTREMLTPRLEETRKAIIDYRITLWEIQSWLKKARSNGEKVDSPRFSTNRFQIDMNEIKRRFSD